MTATPMQRREFITLLGGAAAAWPLAARAQRANAVKRIGYLRTGGENDPVIESRYAGLQQELQKLGWSSGRDLQVDVRSGGVDDDRLRVYAVELVSKAPDVIVVFNTQATAILKQQTSTIPIVFVGVADPVASGFVASFARPGFLSRPIRPPAFIQALRENGFVEGSTVEFDFRWGSFEDQPALATELVRRRVAVIRPNGPSATRAAMAATSTIPIVAENVPAPPKNRRAGKWPGYILAAPKIGAAIK